MASGTIETFQASLAELDVEWTRTTPDGLADAVTDAAVEPTVGAPLPFPDLSLPDRIETAPTPRELEAATTGVTGVTLGIADYGTVAIEATEGPTEPVSLFAERHVAVLRASDLVSGVPEATDELGPKLRDGTSAILQTGPSATGDMGALVYGVHGPKEVHVVIVDDEPAGDETSADTEGIAGDDSADTGGNDE